MSTDVVAPLYFQFFDHLRNWVEIGGVQSPESRHAMTNLVQSLGAFSTIALMPIDSSTVFAVLLMAGAVGTSRFLQIQFRLDTHEKAIANWNSLMYDLDHTPNEHYLRLIQLVQTDVGK